ncbi:hypothetical protein PG997_006157 [Apiospora hydei]|uniref:DUF676 domain-containing protein n=1 Tax=Apiospora hydei TaxID=1337664 RepID=A0ABR1WMZ7_9PEZI
MGLSLVSRARDSGRASSTHITPIPTASNTGRQRSRFNAVTEARAAQNTTGDRTAFFGSQVGGESVINYSYTDTPFTLLMWDIYYFFYFAWALPWIVWPLRPCHGGHFDEMAFSASNMWCLFIHGVLIILQLGFILTLPLLVLLPVWTAILWVAFFSTVNWALCLSLNGPTLTYHSDPKYAEAKEEHAHESWIFINGVACGEAWLLSNINRLALTFGRPVMGIHNKTDGIIFDVIECLVQRNLSYATTDVREAYRTVKEELYNPAKSKVIFILHSQGAIEGSMVLDWLLQEMPQDILSKLEVYTFGAAANHMNSPTKHVANQTAQQNNPNSLTTQDITLTKEPLLDSPVQMRTASSSQHEHGTASKQSSFHEKRPPTPPSIAGDGIGPPALPEQQGQSEQQQQQQILRASSLVPACDRVIGHIEHYAHTTDFVALWGLLHFVTSERASALIPRFIGRVFSRTSSRGGHQFCQHYLDGMFPYAATPTATPSSRQLRAAAATRRTTTSWRASSSVAVKGTEGEDAREGFANSWALLELAGKREASGDLAHPEVAVHGSFHGKLSAHLDDGRDVKVKDLSRLWQYRNGKSPPELPRGLMPDTDGIVRAGTL